MQSCANGKKSLRFGAIVNLFAFFSLLATTTTTNGSQRGFFLRVENQETLNVAGNAARQKEAPFFECVSHSNFRTEVMVEYTIICKVKYLTTFKSCDLANIQGFKHALFLRRM